MSYDEDPEVIADLQLRARSVYDTTRTAREARWTPPVIVDKWPCRNDRCRKPVDVPEEAMDRFVQFNRVLVARGEEKLDFKAILYCPDCEKEFRRTAGDRRRGQVERMRPVIQQVKNSKNPELERAAIKQLQVWGHPDVDGLVQAVRDRLNGKSSGKKAKRDDV